jgi:hypothetical protein
MKILIILFIVFIISFVITIIQTSKRTERSSKHIARCWSEKLSLEIFRCLLGVDAKIYVYLLWGVTYPKILKTSQAVN